MKIVTDKLPVLTLAVATALGVTSVAGAQSAASSAPMIATSVPGIHIFAGPSPGFNALTASADELAAAGLPAKPDAAANPTGYDKWVRNMKALRTRITGVRATSIYHGPRKPAGDEPEAVTSGVPTGSTSHNWSGVAVVNPRTTWSATNSFNYIESIWNVPAAQAPANACSNGITGPFYVSVWNGIDGYANGDVIQGGSQGYVDCSGNTQYVGWVECYPSYPELDLSCDAGSTLCPVSPGDIFDVVTYGAQNKNPQQVFVEDVTQGWYGTVTLDYVNGNGQGVAGSSAEWIVERPGVNGGLAALANTTYDFFDYAYATNGAGVGYSAGKGGPNATLYNISMLADDGATVIEVPTTGTTGFQGLYSIMFTTAACASSGGCTP